MIVISVLLAAVFLVNCIFILLCSKVVFNLVIHLNLNLQSSSPKVQRNSNGHVVKYVRMPKLIDFEGEYIALLCGSVRSIVLFINRSFVWHLR